MAGDFVALLGSFAAWADRVVDSNKAEANRRLVTRNMAGFSKG
jgi:hypothetical protein